MKAKHLKKKRRNKLLFKPDDIATAVREAVQRDLGSAQHAYCRTYDPRSLFASRQIDELLKKYVPAGIDQKPLEEAVYAKFRATVKHVDLHNRRFDLPESAGLRAFSNSESAPRKIMRRARALMHHVLGEFDVEELFLACKHSQGSSIGVPFLDTSVERKWTFPLSATSRIAPVFDEYLVWDSRLRTAVLSFNRYNGLETEKYNIVEGSRATTVDKTAEVRRMIAIEPTVNMFFQQGIMEMMYRRMKAVGLDVQSLPDLHKELAKHSSITGRDATIDWSDASNCVSIELCRWELPPSWFEWIELTRCDSMSLDGEWIKLPMVSTMGNATTFPLETLIFWTLAHAVRLTEQESTHLFPEWEDLNVCSVFGDDCILPTCYALSYIQVCESLGFIVNKEKSFFGAEKFRESCGGDYLAGYDVRPFHLKAPVSMRLNALGPWLYVIANSLLKKYRRYFGLVSYVYGKELWRTIFALFRKYNLKISVVPSYFPDDAGLKIGEDLFRFQYCYAFKLDRIGRDVHGTLAFHYHRFNYVESRRWDDEIRLCTQLKKNNLVLKYGQRALPHEYSTRRLGGYVVAKGLSSQWEVNEQSARSSK